MKVNLKYTLVIITWFGWQVTHAQSGFAFEDVRQRKVVIPFKLINNLIFIPVKVNGIELNFMLDTGVEETVLFSLGDQNEVRFFNAKKIKLTGLGNAESIDGLKSSDNIVSVNGLADKRHDIYIVLDQDFNFSSNIGIPVNGILGYHFFKNHLIEINYDRKRITVYNDNLTDRHKIERKFLPFDMSLERNKPYAYARITLDKNTTAVKLLLDTGNSDAIWLFRDAAGGFAVPELNFEDFLGRGFSGDIYGTRARLDAVNIDKFEFVRPLASYPDMASIQKVSMVSNRGGSIGGEIFRRFTVVFDYRNNKMYLRKGRAYDAPFHYNMSGIEVHHDGMTWVHEKVELKTMSETTVYDSGGSGVSNAFRYKFQLMPLFAVASVRTDSPGAASGLKKGDVIRSLNNKPGYKYSLEEISALLKSDEGKLINMVIERDGRPIKVRFRLKNML